MGALIMACAEGCRNERYEFPKVGKSDESFRYVNRTTVDFHPFWDSPLQRKQYLQTAQADVCVWAIEEMKSEEAQNRNRCKTTKGIYVG